MDCFAHPATLIGSLKEPTQRVLRALLIAAPPPPGASNFGEVTAGAKAAVDAFGEKLTSPSGSFVALQNGLSDLAASTPQREIDAPGVWETKRKHEFWNLLARIGQGSIPGELLPSVGAHLAVEVTLGNACNARLAASMHKLSLGYHPLVPLPVEVKRRHDQMLIQGIRLFELQAVLNPEGANQIEAFNSRVRKFIRDQIFFARNQAHQGIADDRSQSSPQLIASAKQLLIDAESGHANAILTIIAALSGLPEDIALNMPIVGASDEHGWEIGLDVDAGLILTEYSLFSTGRATAKDGSKSTTIASGEVYATPLPVRIAVLLQDYSLDNPFSQTLGSLLGNPKLNKQRTLSPTTSGIRATTARFRNGLGPFAIQLGLNRYSTALAIRDPRVVPTGKFYYSNFTREDSWSTCASIFEHLGWGQPVTFCAGMSVGSRLIPLEATIRDWHGWMAAAVSEANPGRRYTPESLFRHHSTFAKYCASLAVFLLALRIRSTLPLCGRSIFNAITIPVNDKRVGEFPGPRPVPVCHTMRTLLQHWSRHCLGLNQRLSHLGCTESNPSRRALSKLIRGDEGPLFFDFSKAGKPVPLGTQALVDWWPPSFSLSGNFGRHFWQFNLNEAGLHSTDVDAFVRHALAGMDPTSSTGTKTIRDWASRITSVMDETCRSLEIIPVTGLKGPAT